MRALFKLLPAAALGLVAYLNADDMKKYLNIVGKVQVAATSGIEMQGIAEAIAQEYTSEGTLPLNNFGQFLKDNMREKGGGEKRDRSKDPWGTDYKLALKGEGFEVQSAGPDKAWKTEDDLKYFYSLKELGGAGAAAEAAKASGYKPGANVAKTASTVRRTPSAPSVTPKPAQSVAETTRKVVESQMRRAEEGSAQAQYDLGLRYLSGDGVEQNELKALEWLDKAAKSGSKDAERKLQAIGVKRE